jgi:GntR family transcriptional regulator, transcriptional repressor for pyruvate dehydrogenase complex
MGEVRQPRLAELIADQLRERIISGELADGAELPTLNGLIEEFNVSPPSVRQALRILEHEGLITVRRGNVGGAVVHHPSIEGVAYSLGLVLQTRGVLTGDLAAAVRDLLTSCAVRCARRKDRATAVLPTLRAAHQRSVELSDAPELEYERAMRDVHRALVDGCGNETLEVVFSTIEWLWLAQAEAFPARVEPGASPDRKLRRKAERDHAAVLDAITSGDGAEVERLMRAHLSHPEILGMESSDGQRIRATSLTPALRAALVGRDGPTDRPTD